MRICVVKETKRILEMQDPGAEGTLLQNAINAGYSADLIEEKVVNYAGYLAAQAEDPSYIAQQQAISDEQAVALAKLQAINDNLPSRKAIKDAITAAWPAGAQRQIILKIADIVYWLAKGTEA